MGGFLVLITIVLALTLTNTLADVSSLQDQDTSPEHNLNPLNDHDQDLSDNNQDKRTICGAFSKCSERPHVRHVIVKPVKHQLVAYAPIVRPVGIRPVVVGGYKYSKPKIHFRLKSPSSFQPVFGGWSPVHTGTRPAVQVLKPAVHVDAVHTRPVPHVDHAHTPSVIHVDHGHHNHVAAPVHVDHVHVQPGPVHVQPVGVPGAHINQVHQVNVPHGDHYDTFTHVDHIHQAPIPIAQPVAPPPAIVRPFPPSPVLFEVTRPNLGVLPLGARFPHPILREVPHIHVKPAPVAPAVPIAPVPVTSPVPLAPVEPLHQHHYHPAAVLPHQHVHAINPTALGFPHIIPQPGVSVEYHGTRNYMPFTGAVPFLHQSPHAVHPLPPTGFGIPTAYPQQELPFQHAHHGFLSQQHLPHDHQAHGFVSQQHLPRDHQVQGFLSQQHLPHDHQAHGFLSQQQLPNDHLAQFSPEQQLPQQTSSHFLHNQVQAAQPYQEIPQGQLPLEGENNLDQFFQSNQESFSPNLLNSQSSSQSHVIQPGQTDVQIPYHLPQHPGWQGASGFQQQQQPGLQEESRGFGDQVFRPSPQLEAPYKK